MGKARQAEYALPRRIDLEIKGNRENVHLVRSLVDQAARAWRLSDDVRQSGRLVLTELATNAARVYEGRMIRAWVADPGGGGLELAVWDPGPSERPRLLPVSEDAIGGRGLWLVHELSDRRWGWYVSEATHGKVVWALIGPKSIGSGHPRIGADDGLMRRGLRSNHDGHQNAIVDSATDFIPPKTTF